MDLNRRQFLFGGLCAIGCTMLPGKAFSAFTNNKFGVLNLSNLHTGEKLELAYRTRDQYLADGLAKANHFFRDFRTGDIAEMDPRVFDVLYSVDRQLGGQHEVEIISGYRSPKTNAALAEKSQGGVAKKSFHMQGKALDIHVVGQKLDDVYETAKLMKSGGVGIYGQSNFVHIDTGPVRSWVGR